MIITLDSEQYALRGATSQKLPQLGTKFTLRLKMPIWLKQLILIF
jgi:hypothetical protein